MTFIEGDKIKIYLPKCILKKSLHGKTGIVMKWHHDDVYTVYINCKNQLFTIKESEIVKLK